MDMSGVGQNSTRNRTAGFKPLVPFTRFRFLFGYLFLTRSHVLVSPFPLQNLPDLCGAVAKWGYPSKMSGFRLP